MTPKTSPVCLELSFCEASETNRWAWRFWTDTKTAQELQRLASLIKSHSDANIDGEMGTPARTFRLGPSDNVLLTLSETLTEIKDVLDIKHEAFPGASVMIKNRSHAAESLNDENCQNQVWFSFESDEYGILESTWIRSVIDNTTEKEWLQKLEKEIGDEIDPLKAFAFSISPTHPEEEQSALTVLMAARQRLNKHCSVDWLEPLIAYVQSGELDNTLPTKAHTTVARVRM